jgi:hypothetical protein
MTKPDQVIQQEQRLKTFFLNGNFEAGDYTLVQPNLQFASSIVYPQDIDILGFDFGFQGSSSTTGSVVPPGTFIWPILCALVIGLGQSTPSYNILTAIIGQPVTNILAFLNGANGYIPATGDRPELILQTDSATLMFPVGSYVHVPANMPISIYLSLSNNGPYDAVAANAVLYVRESPIV